MRGAIYLMQNAKFPDLAVARREGISWFAYEARDSQTDSELLEWTRSHSIGVLVMRDPSWAKPALTARQLAETMSDDLTRVGAGEPGKPSKGQCAVMPDIEHVHDPVYVYECYRRFRELRKGRGWWLSTEWHQSGWFSRELVRVINEDPLVQYLPQAYETNEMHPVCTEVVRSDCAEHGIAPEKVHPFVRYDRMDIGWEGFVYGYEKAR